MSLLKVDEFYMPKSSILNLIKEISQSSFSKEQPLKIKPRKFTKNN